MTNDTNEFTILQMLSTIQTLGEDFYWRLRFCCKCEMTSSHYSDTLGACLVEKVNCEPRYTTNILCYVEELHTHAIDL